MQANMTVTSPTHLGYCHAIVGAGKSFPLAPGNAAAAPVGLFSSVLPLEAQIQVDASSQPCHLGMGFGSGLSA